MSLQSLDSPMVSNMILAWKVEKKHVVIVGGGKEGLGRLTKTLAAGASITVICPRIGLSPGMEEMMKGLSHVHYLDREFNMTDLNVGELKLGPVDMVLSCVDDRAVSRFIADLARQRKIPVNCADIPDLCDFYFMSEIRQGPLQIGVSTGGSGPRLAVRLKNMIRQALPLQAGEAVANIGILRKRIRLLDPDPEASSRRMSFFSKLCDSLSIEEMAKLTEEQAMAIMSAYEKGEMVTSLPSAYMTPPTSPPRTTSWISSVYTSVVSTPSSPVEPVETTDKQQSPRRFSPVSLVSSVVSMPMTMATSTLETVSHSYERASVAAKSYTKTYTQPCYDSVNAATLTAKSLVSGFSLREATRSAQDVVSRVKQTTSETVYQLKDVAEVTLASGLNQLPSSVESPLRSVLSYLPLPLNIPAKKGKVYLVGAGPGDPELLTVKALNAIKKCDVVISDQLIPEPILAVVRAHLRSTKSLEFVPKKREGASGDAQTLANQRVLEYLAKGRTVVRLKNGDPFIFGRGGEEWSLFAEKGYKVEAVPGISSAMAAPFSAGIPATYRGMADQVLILTGRGERGVLPVLPKYNPRRTTIVLMPVGRLLDLVDLMIENGYPSDAPSAMIQKGTWGRDRGERVVRGPLNSIVERAIASEMASPSVFVVGDVVEALAHIRHSDPFSALECTLETVPVAAPPAPYDDIAVVARRRKASVC